MVIVDTSVWIEYLQGTGSAAHLYLRDRIAIEDAVLVSEVVAMELMQQSGPPVVIEKRSRFLDSFDRVALAPLVDTVVAAELQRACLQTGHRVRSLLDCLIAAQALRVGLPIAHRDKDFELIAQVAPLATVNLLS